MKYYATINKRVRYIKVYHIIKRVNENTNFISKAVQKFIDKHFSKKKTQS